MKIKKGDNVKVLKGKNRGTSGKITKVFPRKNRVIVEKVNMYKKHVRPRQQGQKGQIIDIARPLHASNVMLVCPSCKEPTRIGYRIDGTKKARICKRCNATI